MYSGTQAPTHTHTQCVRKNQSRGCEWIVLSSTRITIANTYWLRAKYDDWEDGDDVDDDDDIVDIGNSM